MPFVFKRLALVLSIAAVQAADKDRAFHVGPAAGYAQKQTQADVIVAAEPYETQTKAKEAFGKLNPYEHGILPVLVVIQNDGKKAIRLDAIKAIYSGPGTNRIEATPAPEVPYVRGPRRPDVVTGPTGGPKIGKSKKNPLSTWEIEGRAFSAKMLPPGQSAHGFFYFQTGLQRGATLLLSGLSEAGTGNELFYFEIPLRQGY
jgi:hypothetical protein